MKRLFSRYFSKASKIIFLTSLFVIGGLLLSGCSGISYFTQALDTLIQMTTDSEEATEAEEQSAEEENEESVNLDLPIGSSPGDVSGFGFIVTLNSYKTVSADELAEKMWDKYIEDQKNESYSYYEFLEEQYSTPEAKREYMLFDDSDSNTYTAINVTYENEGEGASELYVSCLDWSYDDLNKIKGTASYFPYEDYLDDTLKEVTLSPGGTISGNVYFAGEVSKIYYRGAAGSASWILEN